MTDFNPIEMLWKEPLGKESLQTSVSQSCSIRRNELKVFQANVHCGSTVTGNIKLLLLLPKGEKLVPENKNFIHFCHAQMRSFESFSSINEQT